MIVVKGAGDLASGVAYRLFRAGFRPVMTEVPAPTVVRRSVAFAQAVFDGTAVVEGVRSRLVDDGRGALAAVIRGEIPVIVDPDARRARALAPDVLIDAVVAKRNTGTRRGDAQVLIALGPGFRAPADVDAVIETNRGHRLGRVILDGEAEPDTGVPAPVGGYGAERVLRAPVDGVFTGLAAIGDPVRRGEVVGTVAGEPVCSAFDGCLRGLIHDGVRVHAGMKVGDVDPRATREHCFTISDKALAIGGGVLEAVLYLLPAGGVTAGSRRPRPLVVPVR
ncbi:MAG TPA: selenium-dependent molybdenum cofactor biosynthesis protein YqeB [Candidatus Limnocylindria bacterium]|nr:selenium-dependent molybdenum cofactor biosynthesis protein YqeB [Candidatus Limnocylindria bacterium]